MNAQIQSAAHPLTASGDANPRLPASSALRIIAVQLAAVAAGCGAALASGLAPAGQMLWFVLMFALMVSGWLAAMAAVYSVTRGTAQHSRRAAHPAAVAAGRVVVAVMGVGAVSVLLAFPVVMSWGVGGEAQLRADMAVITTVLPAPIAADAPADLFDCAAAPVLERAPLPETTAGMLVHASLWRRAHAAGCVDADAYAGRVGALRAAAERRPSAGLVLESMLSPGLEARLSEALAATGSN